MTVTELRDIATESGISHAEFCLEQHTSQVGRDAADSLWAELGRLADYAASVSMAGEHNAESNFGA
jgi:hypothetical protein